MTFKTVPVDVVGQSYQHRSRSLSSQVTMNLIPEFTPSGRSDKALTAWPGDKALTTGNGGVGRGLHVFKNELYKVTDTTLYKIDSNGVRAVIGTIAGSNPCIFADDGNSMRIATGALDYIYNGSVLAQITDPDLRPGNSVAYLNQQMINDSTGGQFQVSDVGDPDSINSLNVASAESAPDDTVRVFAFNERLYLFGDRNNTETWYNSGTGNPPFDRIQGGTMNIAIGAVYSVAASPDFMYFFGFDKSVYRVSAYQAERITPNAVANSFEGFATSSDARGYTLAFEGQYFYVLNFPTQGETWVYSEPGNAWFQLSTGADQSNYIGTSYAFCYGKHLIESGGDVRELDLDTYTSNDLPMIRERVSAPIVDPTGQRIMMNRFQLIMEVGVGLISGQGVDPQVMFEASYDGGKSWTNEHWVNIGRMGEGRIKVEWFNMASAYEIMVRFRVSDPVFISVHSAAIDLRPGGW